jgi:DNA-directed RNA polymerase subunit RPC12/RpoP
VSHSPDDLLRLSCPACEKRLKVSSKWAGKRIKCPRCEAVVKVATPLGTQPSNVSSTTTSRPDDWLDLDLSPGDTEPKPPKTATAINPTSSESKRKERSSNANEGSLNLLDGASLSDILKASEAAPPAASREREMNSFDSESDDFDELRLQPETPSAAAKASGGENTTSSRPASQANAGGNDDDDDDDDDDEFRLAPLDEPNKPKSASQKPSATSGSSKPTSPTRTPSPRASVDDDPFADLDLDSPLGSLDSPQSADPFADDLLATASRDAANDHHTIPSHNNGIDDDDFTTAQLEEPEDYRVTCSTCGTAQHLSISVAGHSVRCPDCFSSFIAPKVPADWQKKRAAAAAKKKRQMADAVRQQKLKSAAMAESGGPAFDSPYVQSSADRMLADAEREVDEDDSEDYSSMDDFDTAGWLKQSFGLFRDVTFAILTIVTSMMLGAVYFAGALVNEINGTAIGVVFQIGVMGFLGFPVVLLVVANGFAILVASANRQSRVTDWPLFDIPEHMGDIAAMIFAFALATIPGGLLGWLLSLVGLEKLSAAALICSVWLFFPFFVLCILDSQSIMAPFSKAVFGSLRKRTEAWLTLYFVTGIMSCGLFAIYLLGFMTAGKIGPTIAGLATPFFLMFVLMQIGILAGKMGDDLSVDLNPPADDDS